MDTYLPWQIGLSHAGPQEGLRPPNPPNRTPSMSLQFSRSPRGQIGQGLFGLSPNEFIRIEFRGIRRKTMDHQPGRTLLQILLHAPPPMNRASIPQQINRSGNLAQQLTQELNHFLPSDIALVESRRQPQPSITGRDRNGGNNRQTIPPVTVPQNRRLPRRSPGSSHVGDKQEAAFVKECQMGAPLPGVFLYEATHNASSGRYLPRRVGWPAASVSGRSNANRPPRDARSRRHNKECRTTFSPRRQCVSTSIGRWHSRRLARRAPTYRPSGLFADSLAGRDGQRPVALSTHGLRTADNFGATAPPNSTRPPPAPRWHDSCGPNETCRWPFDAGAPKTLDSRLVSCSTS